MFQLEGDLRGNPKAAAVAAAVSLAMQFALATEAAAQEQAKVLPSGLDATLQETIWEAGGTVWRLRFVAPGFAPDRVAFEKVADDLSFLCREMALPGIAGMSTPPDKVLISLADKPSEFGRYDPSVKQVFEAYRIENDTCIVEIF